MSTVRITANDKQLALLIAFCTANKMGCEIETPSAKLHAETAFKTPTPALKQFCGAEMMTSRGKMQPSTVLEFILAYGSRNNLSDLTAIHLNEQLQEVFQTSDSAIYLSELSERVNALFSD